MPGYPEMSCIGSMSYYQCTLRASTSCNKKPGGYKTELEGQLKEGDKLLGKRTATGTTRASFADSKATGYDYGRAIHYVYYRNKVWKQNTNM